jgi:hypothetical protein
VSSLISFSCILLCDGEYDIEKSGSDAVFSESLMIPLLHSSLRTAVASVVSLFGKSFWRSSAILMPALRGFSLW